MPLPEVVWDNFGFSHTPSGISRYAHELYSALATFNIQPLMLRKDFDVSFEPERFTSLLINTNHVETLFTKIKIAWPHIAFKNVNCKINTESCQNKIFHGLSNINLPFLSPKNKNFSYFLTVHDVIPLLDGCGVSLSYKMQFKYMLPRALRYADKVICVSEWTKNLLCERYPENRGKLVVISHGVCRFDKLQSNVQKNYDTKYRLLFVSRWEVYKGFDVVRDIVRSLPPNYELTVVTNNEGREYFRRCLIEEKNHKKIKIKTDVSDRELASLYQGSDLYIHPSKYEGYGLPVWESLSYGTPSIFFKGSALDMLVKSSVAWGMDKNCTVSDWVDIITSHIETKRCQDYKKKLVKFLSIQPNWEEAARQLIKLYNTISE